MTVLTESQFCAEVASRFALPPDRVVPDARLADDLALDSLAVFEVLMLLEELTETRLDDDAMDGLVRVRDAFELYRDRIGVGTTTVDAA